MDIFPVLDHDSHGLSSRGLYKLPKLLHGLLRVIGGVRAGSKQDDPLLLLTDLYQFCHSFSYLVTRNAIS